MELVEDTAAVEDTAVAEALAAVADSEAKRATLAVVTVICHATALKAKSATTVWPIDPSKP